MTKTDELRAKAKNYLTKEYPIVLDVMSKYPDKSAASIAEIADVPDFGGCYSAIKVLKSTIITAVPDFFEDSELLQSLADTLYPEGKFKWQLPSDFYIDIARAGSSYMCFKCSSGVITEQTGAFPKGLVITLGSTRTNFVIKQTGHCKGCMGTVHPNNCCSGEYVRSYCNLPVFKFILNIINLLVIINYQVTHDLVKMSNGNTGKKRAVAVPHELKENDTRIRALMRVRYIDGNPSESQGGHHRTPCEHTVRSHLRHYSNGKVVEVKSYTRGTGTRPVKYSVSRMKGRT